MNRLCSLLVSLCLSQTLFARTLFESGTETIWRYLDDGTPPAAAWRNADFDDSKWKSGKAPLGYGDPGLGTEVSGGGDQRHRFITTWFRRSFDAPSLQPGERLVAILRVDDGVVIYLNGKEVGRTNMPPGPVSADTVAARRVGEDDEGFFLRLIVPVDALRPGQNVIAAEVHQCAAASSDLCFDLALKTVPAEAPEPEVRDTAQKVVTTYNQQHYVGPEMKIPDGYIDGGRGMKFDSDAVTSSREILLVDRERDPELTTDLAFARSPELQALPPFERAQRIAERIDRKTTPPGGMRWLEKTTTQLQTEFKNKALLIGEWVDQCHSGVCRHRSLLFKLLADEAGLRSALVRGNYAKNSPPGGAHAWNELFLDDGRRVLVDVMHQRARQKFPEVTDPEVVRRYLKVDNTPWYSAAPSQ